MPYWLWFIAFFAGYIVLMRWVLPLLGVSTEWRIRVTSSLDVKARAKTTILKENRNARNFPIFCNIAPIVSCCRWFRKFAHDMGYF